MNKQSGVSLMEVLVTMIIILIGLLGIVALQAKAQIAELEAYQRAQAMIMLSDIVDQINVNRGTATCFAITTNTTTGTPFLGGVPGETGHYGSGTCTASTSAYNAQAVSTLDDIDNLLAYGVDSTGVAGMIGARACISYDGTDLINSRAGTGLYTVIVSWQGMSDLVSPAGLKCASGTTYYGSENRRRAVGTTFRLARLFGG